jgi:hypothetical protein
MMTGAVLNPKDKALPRYWKNYDLIIIRGEARESERLDHMRANVIDVFQVSARQARRDRRRKVFPADAKDAKADQEADAFKKYSDDDDDDDDDAEEEVDSVASSLDFEQQKYSHRRSTNKRKISLGKMAMPPVDMAVKTRRSFFSKHVEGPPEFDRHTRLTPELRHKLLCLQDEVNALLSQYMIKGS